MKELRHEASKRLSDIVEHNLCESTSVTYSSLFDRFLIFCNESRPMRIPQSKVYDYLFTLSSYSQKNQAINAIKFYYQYVENKPINVSIARPKKPKRLVRDIPFDRIMSGFNNMTNTKHRAITALMFGCGLRINEVINFRLEWIVKEDQLIRVIGKGDKQREVPYDNNLLLIFNQYSKQYKPTDFLFEGQNKNRYSKTSIANICRKYFDCSPHQLRYSYAMKLQEKGVNLSVIADILGHGDIRTTRIYLRTPKSELRKINILSSQP